jgi:hypothetical protein
MVRCQGPYESCKARTPECEALDRLMVPLRAGNSQEFSRLLPQLAARVSVCGSRCNDPRVLCERRCRGVTEDAGSPQRP